VLASGFDEQANRDLNCLLFRHDHTDEAQVAGWAKITTALHARGTLFFLQLWHCGRASRSSFHGGQPAVSASAIKIAGDTIHTSIGKEPYEVPRALETADVGAVVEDYRRAAERAKAAGFDGQDTGGSFQGCG